MYFAIAYDLWPHLTGRAMTQLKLMRWQLWLWFIGMIVLTFPWHFTGILGMPRRMAFFDYTDPELAAQAMSVIISTIGGLILVVSAVMFFIVLIRAHRGPRVVVEEYRFSTAVHESKTIPVALNSFGLWLALMIGLTLFNYGYPIASLVSRSDTSVPAIPIGGPQR
jgi:cytochrome c oxidase subunit 1